MGWGRGRPAGSGGGAAVEEEARPSRTHGRGRVARRHSRRAAWIGDTEGLGAPAGSQGGIGPREESEEWRTEEISVVIGLGCRVGFVSCAVRAA